MRRFLWAAALACAAWGMAAGVHAKDAPLVSSEPELDKRVVAVTSELRCLVCQNETIAASSADLAVDLRNQVREMLRKHKNLWCDLAFRSDQGPGGKVPAEWRAAFTEFPDRFMIGTDTYTPERWHYIVEHASWSRAWLADLPAPLAERIAHRNAEALFAGWDPARSQ